MTPFSIFAWLEKPSRFAAATAGLAVASLIGSSAPGHALSPGCTQVDGASLNVEPDGSGNSIQTFANVFEKNEIIYANFVWLPEKPQFAQAKLFIKGNTVGSVIEKSIIGSTASPPLPATEGYTITLQNFNPDNRMS